MAGLTAAEAAAKYDQDTQALQTQNQQIIQQVQSYVQQMQQQPQTQAIDSDPDLWVTDAQRAEQNLTARLQQQWSQQAQAVAAPIYQGQASLAKSGSQNDPRYRDVWTKYGREIEQLMSNVPVNQTINKEVWDQAAKLIKSNHVDEIAAEKAKELALAMGNLETGTPVTAPLSEPQTSAIQKIRQSDYGKTNLQYYDDAKLLNTASKMGISIDEYAEMVSGTHVIQHPKHPGEMVNRDLVQKDV